MFTDKANAKASNLKETPELDQVQNTKFRITIEPVGFLYLTAGIIQHIATPNLYLFKACHVNFGFSEKICDPANQSVHIIGQNYSGLIDRVQAYVSTLHIYGSLIDNIPSVFFVLFLGPWSDRHGRKPLMIIPIVGHLLNTLLFILNYYVESLPAEYLLIAHIPIGVFGGMVTFIMALNRYVMDITTTENRTYRLSLLSGMIGAAVPFAHFVSIHIYNGGGPMAVWGTTLGLYTAALLYLIIFVRETSGKANTIEDNGNKDLEMSIEKDSCSAVFGNLWKCFTITFKKRPGLQRAVISILIFMICFSLFLGSAHGVTYLYTRKKFGWNAPDYALFTTINSSISLIGSLLLIPLLSGYLKWPDGVIGLISLSGNLTTVLIIGFAVSPLMMYLSAISHILVSGIGVVIKSIFSKAIPRDELSHVYSVVASLDSIVPLLASPTFNLIYKATLQLFIGTVFLFEAGCMVIVIALFITILVLQKKDKHSTVVPMTLVDMPETLVSTDI